MSTVSDVAADAIDQAIGDSRDALDASKSRAVAQIAETAQAVGGAVGHNRVSIIIPCHRVVGSGGSLTGYAGGLENKIKLLTLEGADLGGLYRPTKGTAL